MAGNAGCWRTLEDAIFMALFATYLGMCALQLEGRKVVIKCGVSPAFGSMTSRAIRAKLTFVFIVVLMTGITILGRAFEHIIDMALFTFHLCMSAFQLED